MPKVNITKEYWKCNKCGHTWESRKDWDNSEETDKPIQCPKCKNPRWNMGDLQ